tara:strand:- start:1369 stop:6807 length:5439 start_codon:yes stop_codon:yes gene_type:complete
MSTTKIKVFGQQPYYDDFNEAKGFYRVLYRPGFAVQARELTQMQTSIQAQIDRAGQYAFKDGSRVIKGQVTLNTEFDYIQLEDVFNSTLDSSSANLTTSNYLTDFVGTTITGSDNTGNQVTAKVLKAVAANSTSGAPLTLYIKYKNKGGPTKTIEKFGAGEEFQSNTSKFGKILTNGATVNSAATQPIGVGSIATLAEGVYFISGAYVYVSESDVILDAYSNTPSYLIGLTVTEEEVNSGTDGTLVDNALGTSNASAPGANRYKISAVLSKDSLTKAGRTIDNFITLLKVKNGITRIDTTDDTGNTELTKRLARRTFEESGNYAIRPYQLDIKEHLNDEVGNNGLKTSGQGGDANKIALGVEPNVAYIQGFRNENLGTTYIDVDKPRHATNDTSTETGTVTQLVSGNYIRLDRTGTSSSGPALHSAMKGLPPINNLDTIDLHSVRIGGTQSGSNKIGTARVKEIVKIDNNEAHLYLFDITMSAIDANNDYNFSSVQSVSYADSGSQDFIADLKSGFEGKRFKSSKSGAVWKLPYDAVKDVPTVTYEVRRREKINVTSGFASISTGSGEAFEDAANDIIVAPGTGTVLAGSQVTLSTSTATAITINAGAMGISNGTQLIIITTIQKTAAPKTKSLQTGSNKRTQTINVTNGSAASYNLDRADIYRIISITDVLGDDVTDRFTLDDGQRDNFYTNGSIIKKPGSQPIAVGNMAVVYEWWQHGSGDYITRTGYQGADAYEKIGTFNSSRDGLLQLRDCIDFRPVKDNTGANFSGTGAVLHDLGVPKANSNVTATIQYYLPRKDKLIQTINGEFKVIPGVSSERPVSPEDPEDAIIIANVDMPAYVFNVSDIRTRLVDNKRYTMRDIGNIDKRVKNLEYYTSLSLLEKSANDTQIFDGNDERFKNGILVDGFYGHNVGDPANPDYNTAVDDMNGMLRPAHSTKAVTLVRLQGENNSQSNKCDKNGSIVTMDKVSDVEFVSQPYATTHINVNPYDVFTWGGTIKLSPESDVWKEVDVRPDIVIDDTAAYDQFIKQAEEENILGTVWNEWETNWTGTQIDEWDVWEEGLGFGFIPGNLGGTITTTSSQTRSGLNTSVVADTITKEVGNEVIKVNFLPFMRSIKVHFDAQLMKPNTKLFPFFNGVDISSYVKEEAFQEFSDIADTVEVRTYEGTTTHPNTAGVLETDNSGRCIGSFIVPRNDVLKFKAGTREFRLSDRSDNDKALESTFAETQFHSQGLLEVHQKTIISTKVPRLVTTEVQDNRTITETQNFAPIRWVDPLAQTFLVDEKGGIFLTSVDLYFRTKDAEIPVNVSIRSVENGIPTQKVVPGSEVIKYPADSLSFATSGSSTPTTAGDIAVTGIATDTTGRYGTRFTFEHPVYLPQDGEFSIVVMAQTNEYNCFISEMGEFDLQDTTKRVSKQPYNGVLFTSQNASTWTPEQNKDLKFNINRASFNTGAASEINIVNRKLPGRLLKPAPFRIINSASNADCRIRVNHPNHGMHVNGSKVKFEGAEAFHGITAAQLNSSTGHSISEIEHNSYTITIANATTSAIRSGGGSSVRAYGNVYMDVAKVLLQNIQLPNTETKFYLRTYNTHSIDGAQGNGTLQTERQILVNRNLTFENPQVIYNELNEAEYGDSDSVIANKSFHLRVVMTTERENISPVIDLNRAAVTGTQNIINDAASDTGSYDESNGDGRSHVAETVATGGSELSKYITKEVSLNDEATVIRALLNINKPSNASVNLYYKVLGAGSDDSMNDIAWEEITPDDAITSNNYGQFQEVEYNKTPGDNFGSMMFKIVLRSKNSSTVPKLKDFRVIAAT